MINEERHFHVSINHKMDKTVEERIADIETHLNKNSEMLIPYVVSVENLRKDVETIHNDQKAIHAVLKQIHTALSVLDVSK